jgi:hypothetical protein
MRSELYARSPERYEPLRANLNLALAFAGLAVNPSPSGELDEVEQAHTLTEAKRRAAEPPTDLEVRRVHPDVLRFCRGGIARRQLFPCRARSLPAA